MTNYLKKVLVLIIAIATIISCEKEEVDEIPIIIPESIRYTALEVGNYWVYKHYFIDTSGVETESSIVDSVVISRDTIINDNKFFIVEGTNYPYSFGAWGIIDILRDSSGYLVNNTGNIKFALDNFQDTLVNMAGMELEDTIYTLSYIMEEPGSPVTVPAGTFNVINYKGTVKYNDVMPGIINPRYLNTYYAENIGKVLDTYYFYDSPFICEKRLVRYNINGFKNK